MARKHARQLKSSVIMPSCSPAKSKCPCDKLHKIARHGRERLLTVKYSWNLSQLLLPSLLLLLMLVMLLVMMVALCSSRRPHIAITIGVLAVCSWSSSRSRRTAGAAVVPDTAVASPVGDADADRTRVAYAVVATSTVASTVVTASVGATVASAVGNSATGGSVRLRQLLDDARKDRCLV